MPHTLAHTKLERHSRLKPSKHVLLEKFF